MRHTRPRMMDLATFLGDEGIDVFTRVGIEDLPDANRASVLEFFSAARFNPRFGPRLLLSGVETDSSAPGRDDGSGKRAGDRDTEPASGPPEWSSGAGRSVNYIRTAIFESRVDGHRASLSILMRARHG